LSQIDPKLEAYDAVMRMLNEELKRFEESYDQHVASENYLTAALLKERIETIELIMDEVISLREGRGR
jgi:hypothetical protein